MRYTVQHQEIRMNSDYMRKNFKGQKFEVEIAHTGPALADPHDQVVAIRFWGNVPDYVVKETMMQKLIDLLVDVENYTIVHDYRVVENRMGFRYWKLEHEFRMKRRETL